MKLEDQVCSLDLAKRLKELGVERESLFYWENKNGEWRIVYDNSGMTAYSHWIPAFTVAELGEMLPRLVHYRIWQQHSTDTSKLAGKWAITINDVKDDKFTDLTADTEADARAKMLIYLLENNLTPLN